MIQSSESFARIHLVGSEEVLVDIAIDVAARHLPVVTIVGPTFNSEELAGRKLLALYDRAEARDFVDVFVLCEVFGKDLILARAAEIEGSVDRSSLAEMMGAISRFTDRARSRIAATRILREMGERVGLIGLVGLVGSGVGGLAFESCCAAEKFETEF